MRESGLALALVPRADAKPGVVRDDGRAVVLAKQELEAISEAEALHVQGRAKRDRLQMGYLPVRGRARVQFCEAFFPPFRARATHQGPSSLTMESEYRKSASRAPRRRARLVAVTSTLELQDGQK